MTLPASGLIKFSEIQTEFGGTNPISLSEYYGSDTVPASGLISMSDFHGTSDLDTVMDLLVFSPTSLGGASGTAVETVTGITGPISMKWTNGTLYGTIVVTVGGTVRTDGVAFTANNNDAISVQYTATGTPGSTQFNGTVTFINITDSNQLVGTVSMTAWSDEPPSV